MPDTNAYVQIAPDSTGKKIDNTVLTGVSTVDGSQTILYRQRINVGDSLDPGPIQTVVGESGRGEALISDRMVLDVLNRILDSIERIENALFNVL